jgi:hypothetical protein
MQRIITMFTRASNWILTYAILIQSNPHVPFQHYTLQLCSLIHTRLQAVSFVQRIAEHLTWVSDHDEQWASCRERPRLADCSNVLRMPGIKITFMAVLFNLWYAYPRGTRRHFRRYAKTSCISQNGTQEPLDPWTNSDPHIHEDPLPNWGAVMLETSPINSLTGQNHINNW